jgi:N-carbamoylputrescine amidase
MRVALAQIDSVLGDTDKNLRKAKEVVAEAKNRGADLTVFPELSLSGYALEELDDDLAIEAQSETIGSLAEAAGEMAVVVGSARRGSASRTTTALPTSKEGHFATCTASSTCPTTGSTKRESITTRGRACAPSIPSSAAWPS